MKVNDVIRLRHLIRKSNERKVHEERLLSIMKFNTQISFNFKSYDEYNKQKSTLNLNIKHIVLEEEK